MRIKIEIQYAIERNLPYDIKCIKFCPRRCTRWIFARVVFTPSVLVAPDGSFYARRELKNSFRFDGSERSPRRFLRTTYRPSVRKRVVRFQGEGATSRVRSAICDLRSARNIDFGPRFVFYAYLRLSTITELLAYRLPSKRKRSFRARFSR